MGERSALKTLMWLRRFASKGAKYIWKNVSGSAPLSLPSASSSALRKLSTLEEPYTEHVTPQPLRTVEGTNTVSVVSNVDSVDLEVEYKKRLE